MALSEAGTNNREMNKEIYSKWRTSVRHFFAVSTLLKNPGEVYQLNLIQVFLKGKTVIPSIYYPGILIMAKPKL